MYFQFSVRQRSSNINDKMNGNNEWYAFGTLHCGIHHPTLIPICLRLWWCPLCVHESSMLTDKQRTSNMHRIVIVWFASIGSFYPVCFCALSILYYYRFSPTKIIGIRIRICVYIVHCLCTVHGTLFPHLHVNFCALTSSYAHNYTYHFHLLSYALQ